MQSGSRRRGPPICQSCPGKRGAVPVTEQQGKLTAEPGPRTQDLTRRDWVVLARMAVSGIVLSTASFIILSRLYPDDYVKWSFWAIGAVFAYRAK